MEGLGSSSLAAFLKLENYYIYSSWYICMISKLSCGAWIFSPVRVLAWHSAQSPQNNAYFFQLWCYRIHGDLLQNSSWQRLLYGHVQWYLLKPGCQHCRTADKPEWYKHCSFCMWSTKLAWQSSICHLASSIPKSMITVGHINSWFIQS